MRLLHVTHQYRPAIGGAEKYFVDLSEELARRGHVVDVYTSRSVHYPTWENVLPRREVLNDIKIYRFNSLRRNTFAWRALSFGLSGYFRSRSWWYEPFILYGNGPILPGMFAAILRHGSKYDLVHINNLHYAHAWLAYRAVRCHDLPLLITPHVHKEQLATHDVGYLWRILRESDGILADTAAEKAYLAERLDDVSITVGGVGLRVDDLPSYNVAESRMAFGLPEQGFVILHLGRKTEYKGLDVSLEAFVALRRERRDVYFLVIGPETEFSQQLKKQYTHLKGLVWRGAVSDEQRLQALAACDVLTLPSTGEAFGIVYLEAWAYAKPVIGARIASVSSLIEDGKDGFLVAPRQLASLVHFWGYLADHPKEASIMGAQGRAKLLRRYTVERITDIVEGFYARVLRHRST